MALIKELIQGDKKHDITPVFNKEIGKYFCKNYNELNENQISIITNMLMDCFNNITNCTGYFNAGEVEYSADNKINLKHPDTFTKKDEKLYITSSVRKNKDGEYYFYKKTEDNLERLIAAVFQIFFENTDCICENQFPIPETFNASHIDLLVKQKNILNFVELKQWDNKNDSPVWALAECVKNVYLYLNFWNHLYGNYTYKNKINNYEKFKSAYDLTGIDKFVLIILAPQDYYNIHNPNGSLELNKTFKKLCVNIQNRIKESLRKYGPIKNLEVEILVKKLNFEQTRFKEIVDIIINEHKKEKGLNIVPDKKCKGMNTGKIQLMEHLDILNKNDLSALTSWILPNSPVLI